MKGLASMPIPVKSALRKLGHDIRDSRRRRRITMALMAERCLISRVTLTKVEKGDPAVAMGTYATVLFVLGLTKNLAELVDANNDQIGRSLEEQNLPQRVRLPRE